MSDTTYELFQHYGTSAERAAFTPDPAAGIKPIYIWFETDTEDTYLYHTEWIKLTSAAGSGDVVGPASAEDNNLALFDTTTGKKIKDSGKTIAEVISDAIAAAGAGDVVGPASAENHNVAIYDGTTGRLLEDGLYTIAEIIAAGGAAAPQGDVTAAAVIDDNTIVRGDGGAKGVQKTGITVDDNDNVAGIADIEVEKLHITPSNHSAAGVTETIDFAVSNEHTVILDENVTLTLSNPEDGGRYVIVLIQDGSGGNTVTWPASVKWPGGSAPTITSTAGKADIVTLYYYATGSVYLAAISQNYATS